MSIIYLIGFIVIIKSLYSLCKKNNISQSTIAIQEQIEPEKPKNKWFLSLNFNEFSCTTTIQGETEHEKPKNKWLYPTDEFGKMEEGMVYEFKTYESGIRDNKKVPENLVIRNAKTFNC